MKKLMEAMESKSSVQKQMGRVITSVMDSY